MKAFGITLCLLLTLPANAQIVLNGECDGEEFIGNVPGSKTIYSGFCEYDGTVSILDPKTRTYFIGFCQDGALEAANAKTRQKITGTCITDH